MKYNRYINDSPQVSEIGLGAWQLGENSGWQRMSEKEVVELVEKHWNTESTSLIPRQFMDTAPGKSGLVKR